MGVTRPASVVHFGSFQLDLRTQELRRNGIKVRIPDQSIQVLAMLLEHCGEVVTRQELQQRLWPNGTIVEFEHGVNSAINRLRQGLEDSADEPKFIETLPRRGYRFLFPVDKAAAPTHASIAVLPFANLSADKESEYFSDGLAEEIINALTQIQDLRVAARSSSFSFKGRDFDISQIATKLNVANVLEGSVRRAGDRVRVTVQLVDVATGFHTWSERYDRQIKDLFELQDEIARAITDKLNVSLSCRVKRTTENLAAYELYLKGRHYWHHRLPTSMHLAIRCFEDAIKLDPRYALAYAGLADCYGILAGYAWMPPKDVRSLAHAAVMQAMNLAPSLWEVNFSRGFYAFWFEPSWREAEPYFQKAILINPRSSLARVYYGFLLATNGRADDAVAQTTLACQGDALSPLIHGLTSCALYIVRRFDEAERMAQHALELQPGYLVGLWTRGMALSVLGRHHEAIEMLERLVTTLPAPLSLGLLGLAYARGGRLGDAARLLHELEDRSSRGEYVPTRALLHIYIGQGDTAAIRRALSESLAEGTPPFVFRTTSSPFLEEYRGDPEIDRLLSKLYGR